MDDLARLWWERHRPEFQALAELPVGVQYGPQVTEERLHLIGPVAGRRLLEIGCGGAQCGIAFARAGAIMTGIYVAVAEVRAGSARGRAFAPGRGAA